WNQYYWLKVEDPAFFIPKVCPYRFVLSNFELEWGKTEKELSPRKKEDLLFWFISTSRHLHESGLFDYLPERPLSDSGKLNVYLSALGGCEWKHSSLAYVMNAIAEWELDLAYDIGKRWIREIEHGANPGIKIKMFGGISLTRSCGILTLYKW